MSPVLEQTGWVLEHADSMSEKWMISIKPFPFLIGRDENCNLTIQSKWVSRHHAEIHVSGGMLWIRDLGSTNGTFVNHRPILKSEMLEAGDILGFGKSEFHVRKTDPARSAGNQETIAMDPDEDLGNLVSLEPVLRKLLREKDVIAHFQPIVNFSDLGIIGYEILGRIGEGVLPVAPGELFDIASILGCAPELSSLFRETGVGLGKELPGSPLLFVNSDPSEMDRLDGLLGSLKRVREITPSSRIVLEINEKAVPKEGDMEMLRDSLTELNIALAFDDFGVGQTRLAELAKSPPDFLKFDISLVRHIHLAPKRLHMMLLTFINAARDLGIATLAEGVECLEEGDTCRDLGFDYGQGFYYGKPSPVEVFGAARGEAHHPAI